MLPIQTGTGDPSPENIRPIYGHTSATAYRAGKNLIDQDTVYGVYKQDDGSFSGETASVSRVNFLIPSAFVGLPLTFRMDIKTSSQTPVTNLKVRAFVNGAAKNGNIVDSETYETSSVTFTPETPNDYISISYSRGGSAPMQFKNVQLELGSAATAYEPYQGDTYTVSFGQTVYGGTLDFAAGVLTATWGYIASYNGETLSAEWISDRDVYAAGTTPTTGAEVAYKLATPQTIQLTPQEITTLLGTNNIWVTAVASQ